MTDEELEAEIIRLALRFGFDPGAGPHSFDQLIEQLLAFERDTFDRPGEDEE